MYSSKLMGRFVCLSGWALLAVLVAGCLEQVQDASNLPCKPGFSEVCYSGPEGTRDVGLCRAGLSLCTEEGGEVTQRCFGEVLPTTEVCDGQDNDCDGVPDNQGACSQQAVSDLEEHLGDLSLVKLPDRVGPAYMVRPTASPIVACGAKDNLTCATDFLNENRAVYGITQETSAFEHVESVVLGDGVTSERFRQTAEGVPILDTAVSITVTSAGILTVHARCLPEPTGLSAKPILSELQVRSRLPEGSKAVESQGLGWYLGHESSQPDAAESESGPDAGVDLDTGAYRLSYGFSYEAADGTSYRVRMDANDGSVLSGEILTLQAIDWQAPDLYVKKVLTQAPFTNQPEAEAAWDIINNWLPEFLGVGDLLETADLRFPFDVYLGEGLEGDGLGYYNPKYNLIVIRGEIGNLFGDTMRHELNHWVVAMRWGWSYLGEWQGNTFIKDTRQYALEHNAIVEVFSQFGGELMQCYQYLAGADGENCMFRQLENDARDFSQPLAYDVENEIRLDEYIYGRVVGYPLYNFWKNCGQDSEACTVKLAVLWFKIIKMMQTESRYDFNEFWITTQEACQSLVALNRTWTSDLSGSAEIRFTAQDCTLLRAGFLQTRVTAAGQLPSAEICNGLDDDYNGMIDDDPHRPGQPLSRPCSSAGQLRPEVGICRNGVSVCDSSVGEFGPCVDEVPSEAESCDGLDNDCDGYTDEGVLNPYSPDLDGDGAWSDADTAWVCPGQEPAGYILRLGAVSDCDDNDTEVYPGADECDYSGLLAFPPGDGIDNNCNGSIDEACGCNPQTYQSTYCGPVAEPCKGKPFDTNDVPQCTVSYSSWCRAGIQRCEALVPGSSMGVVSPVCYGAQTGGPEICDGLDNDCDTLVDGDDLDLAGLSPVCGNGGHEVCQGGQIVCEGNQPSCQWASTSPVTLPKFLPPGAGNGDNDFAGAGPRVTASLTIGLSSSATQIVGSLSVHMVETEEDWTECSGTTEIPLYSAPAGCIISDVSSVSYSCVYTDTDHNEDIFPGTTEANAVCPIPGQGPLLSWAFTGDVEGPDVGVKSSASASIGPIQFKLCCGE